MAEVAIGKRIKISKIQQQIMLAVLGASLVLGVSAVFSVFFFKYINFNSTVISEKDNAINSYYKTIKNVGICIDTNKDGKITDKELNECNPDAIEVADIPNTLRYNVLINSTKNNDLEAVARDSLEGCRAQDGTLIDFSERYINASSDDERAQMMNMIKMCSSLRAIADSLPANKNVEALLASVNKIFELSKSSPEGLSPNNSSEVSPVSSLEVIPVSISINKSASETTRLLENLEKSIRVINITAATISWRGSTNGVPKLELNARALAYYTNQVQAAEHVKTIYASKDARKASNGVSEYSIDSTDMRNLIGSK